MNPRHLEDLVLARLAAPAKSPPTPSEVARGLFSFVSFRLSEAEWRRELQEIVARLRAAGHVDPKRLTLTESGAGRLAQALGMTTLPPARGWREFKAKHLPRLVDGGRSPELSSKDPALGVVAQGLGVPATAARSESSVGDAWLMRHLGLRGKKPTLDAVRAALLARELGLPERPRTKDVLHLYAVKLTGARSAKRDDILEARARRWLETTDRQPNATLPAAAPEDAMPPEELPSTPRPVSSKSPQGAIEKILAAARAPGTARFGDGKAFIGSVWQRLATDPDVGELGEAGFKRLLVEAHQRGDLTLSRADLVSAMDPNDVAASETRHLNATYHFIQISGDRS